MTKLLILSFIFITLSNILAQDNGSQKYIFENKTIQIRISAKKINYKTTDTLNLKFTLENVSEEDIFYFKRKPGIDVVKNVDSTYEALVINYRDDYFSDMETWQEMNILEPGESISFKLKISMDSLAKIGYENSISIIFGIGYISSFKDLEKFQYISSIKPSIKDGIITVSARVLNKALKRLAMRAFGITLEK